MNSDSAHWICPFCGDIDESCDHLLLVIDVDESDVHGLLKCEVDLLNDAFENLYRQVAKRQAVCGTGILYAATRSFFFNYGYIAGDKSGELYAELDRDYAREYLMDALDRAPNLERKEIDGYQCMWSEMPEAARALVIQGTKEIQRLVTLP